MSILLAVLGAAIGYVPTQTDIVDPRCGIALSYVRDVVNQARGQRLVFSTSEQPPHDVIKGGWFEAGTDPVNPKAMQAPTGDLADGIRRIEGNAVRRCSTVRQFLQAQGVAYGPLAVKAALTGDASKAHIETVSLPVVSQDQHRAVLERSTVRHPEDGGGRFELLERNTSGQWKVIGFRPTWMS